MYCVAKRKTFLHKCPHGGQVVLPLKLFVGEQEQSRIAALCPQLLPLVLHGEQPGIEAKAGLLLTDEGNFTF